MKKAPIKQSLKMDIQKLSKNELRKAIILSEVLGQPKSKRIGQGPRG